MGSKIENVIPGGPYQPVVYAASEAAAHLVKQHLVPPPELFLAPPVCSTAIGTPAELSAAELLLRLLRMLLPTNLPDFLANILALLFVVFLLTLVMYAFRLVRILLRK